MIESAVLAAMLSPVVHSNVETVPLSGFEESRVLEVRVQRRPDDLVSAVTEIDHVMVRPCHGDPVAVEVQSEVDLVEGFFLEMASTSEVCGLKIIFLGDLIIEGDGHHGPFLLQSRPLTTAVRVRDGRGRVALLRTRVMHGTMAGNLPRLTVETPTE